MWGTAEATEAEPQRPLETASGRVRALEHERELVVRRPDVGEEPLPEPGQLDAATGAVHELGAELVLEPAQTLADPSGA